MEDVSIYFRSILTTSGSYSGRVYLGEFCENIGFGVQMVLTFSIEQDVYIFKLYSDLDTTFGEWTFILVLLTEEKKVKFSSCQLQNAKPTENVYRIHGWLPLPPGFVICSLA